MYAHWSIALFKFTVITRHTLGSVSDYPFPYASIVSISSKDLRASCC